MFGVHICDMMSETHTIVTVKGIVSDYLKCRCVRYTVSVLSTVDGSRQAPSLEKQRVVSVRKLKPQGQGQDQVLW